MSKIRIHTGRIYLADGPTVNVNITRTGNFSDPRYGEFSITRAMLEQMVANFDSGAYGQKIFADLNHRPQDGAAGEFYRLWVECAGAECCLMGEIELTPYGEQAVRERGFVYLSAEFSDDWVDNETKISHGCVLHGAALTTRPVIKRLTPITLSEEDCQAGYRIFCTHELIKSLSEDYMKDEFIRALREKLEKMKLAEELITKFISMFEDQTTQIDDKQALQVMSDTISSAAYKVTQYLSENPTASTIKLDFSNMPAPIHQPAPDIGGEVKKQLAEIRKSEAVAAKNIADAHASNMELFRVMVKAEKGLDDVSLKMLSDAEELIEPGMSEHQVMQLAAFQIKQSHAQVAARKLASMGFPVPQGVVRLISDEVDNSVKGLSEQISARLKFPKFTPSEENKKLAENVLAQYDEENISKLMAEAEMFKASNGSRLFKLGGVSDVAMPASVLRNVIQEAVLRLRGTEFVEASTPPFAQTWQYFYDKRDTSAAGRRDTRKYQGQGVSRANIQVASATGYPIPQKIAFKLSVELIKLSQSGLINWDVMSRNAANAMQIINEDTDVLIHDEMLQSSDEYGAVAVSSEALTFNGTNRVYPLANFPVVKPRRVYDLQGNQIGSTTNPITVTYTPNGGSAAVLSEYDGTGDQSAGKYYVLDLNMGEIYFTDEDGAIQTPAALDACTVSYSKAVNVTKFDSVLPSGVTDKQHWANFIYHFGTVKTQITKDRLAGACDMSVMSEVLMNMIERAETFETNASRAGSNTDPNGLLARLRAVPVFDSPNPYVALGESRILLGKRYTSKFALMSPWSLGAMSEVRDPTTGKFTGEQEAYGTQYVGMETPVSQKGYFSSMVIYSSTARVARVNP